MSSENLFEARADFKSGHCLTFGSTYRTMEIGVTSIKSCFLFVTETDNLLNSGLSDACSVTLNFDSLMFKHSADCQVMKS